MMIKKEFRVGTSTLRHPKTKKDHPISLLMEVYDVAPKDWVDKVHPVTGELVARPMTIGELKLLWKGKLQGPLSHPLSQGKRFQFDLSPWAHLPDDTYLNIEWPYGP